MRLFRRRRGSRSLCACEACGADYVIPVEWGTDEDHAWWMRLRCGECGHRRELDGVPDAVAQTYDRELDRGVDVIAGQLRGIEREQMAAEAERFVLALRLDLLDASDFGSAH
jgi:DNA-directed RNA polymerase subunit RPC12/RpoP